MGANIFSISGPTRFIKSFQKEKQSKLFANMSISCWSVCIVIWSMVDIWCVACSSFVSSADDGQKTHNEHNKEGPALRKRWLLGLIYNYEHLLNAVDSSQYLTVCHATCLSFVRTRLGSHWCWKKNETETYNPLMPSDFPPWNLFSWNPALHVLQLVKFDCWSQRYWGLLRQGGQ